MRVGTSIARQGLQASAFGLAIAAHRSALASTALAHARNASAHPHAKNFTHFMAARSALQKQIVASGDEEEASVSGSEDTEEFELEGNLKTNLVWDVKKRQLSISLRQYVQTRMQAEVKYRGMLNTDTGDHHMRAHLLKTFQTNTLSLQNVYAAARLQTMRQRLLAEGSGRNKELLQQVSSRLREIKIDPDTFLPAGLKPLLLTDWCLCPGMTYDSQRGSAAGLCPALLIKKAPQLLIHSPRTDLMLSGKLLAEFDPSSSSKVHGTASLRLKLFKFNVTSKQDLKVSMGLDLATRPLQDTLTPPTSTTKSWYRSPYLKISENNTSLKWQGGRWLFQYAL